MRRGVWEEDGVRRQVGAGVEGGAVEKEVALQRFGVCNRESSIVSSYKNRVNPPEEATHVLDRIAGYGC